jgi:hypothetical protein
LLQHSFSRFYICITFYCKQREDLIRVVFKI